MMDDPHLPSYDDAEKMKGAAHEAHALFENDAQVETSTDADFTELAVACRFAGLFAEKVRFAHSARSDRNLFADSRQARMQWKDSLRQAADEFAECWRRRNKTSGLDDVLRALFNAEDDITSGAS